MNQGKYIFSQIVEFIPQRYFERMMTRYNDRTGKWSLTSWNQMLVLMFGQLDGCNSLRELTDVTTAHAKKSFHLGFGRTPVNRTQLSKVNQLRYYHIFEEFAYHMVKLAQKKRIDKEFVLNGKYYAFDSTTIDLCMSLFEWAQLRSTKSGIKVHTQLDIVTQIPVSFNITEAAVHDVNAMDWINYEPFACYNFDRGYYAGNYPSEIRRIVYFEPELKRTFTYYTNNFYLKAKDIAFLYKNRWVVEIFFKWIKSHSLVKFFWGNTENAVRIHIYVAITTYCAVAIIERTLELNRSTNEEMRILGSSLLAKDNLKDLFQPVDKEQINEDSQLELELEFY